MRVLVTLDGSELADRALQAIAPWAAATGSEVVLLRVLDAGHIHETASERRSTARPSTTLAFALRGVAVVPPHELTEERGQALERARIEAEEELRDRGKHYLDGAAWGVAVEWSDKPAEAIASYAEKHGVDFVAMGTHGRSGLGEALLGSVAAAVVRHSAVPVMLVSDRVRLTR